MKKILLISTIFITLIISGCTNNQHFTIKSQKYTDKQQELLTLTGNNASKYELENIPNNKDFEIKIMYEVYENTTKIKEQLITSMLVESTKDTIEDIPFAINIQENIIRLVSKSSSSEIKIDEDLSNLSSYWLSYDSQINLNDTIYLFIANEDNNTNISNESFIFKDQDINKIVTTNNTNVFIKLVFTET